MVGFVYKYTNLINGMWYIGSHRGSIFDKYSGSGSDWKIAKKKFGLHNFKRDILYIGPDYVIQEEWYLSALDAMTDPMSYNKTNIRCGVTKHSEETKLKMSFSLRGKTNQQSPEARKRRSEISKKIGSKPPSNKGNKHSKETRDKISSAIKEWHKNRKKIISCIV